MQVIIQAGGKGTRLAAFTGDVIPKPMVEINGKPLILWQIEALKRAGVVDFIIITGHMGRKITDFLCDGHKYGVSIQYIKESEPLGTAGALHYLSERLTNDDFIFVYGDVIFDIDIDRVVHFHEEKNAVATLFVHPNSHPQDSDLVILDDDCRVTAFDSKHNIRDYWYDNLVNAGFYILNRSICREVPNLCKMDFEKELLSSLIEKGVGVYGYRSPEYIKDAGTPERLARVGADLAGGIVSARNLKNRQKCVFLDRDGTINEEVGLLYDPEQLTLIRGAAEAVRMINESGYLAVVVTNQPVVARGLCSEDDVRNIHRKLTTLLGREGAYLDGIAFCPHHPDKGYPEENAAYKISCDCRKPGTGMIDALAAEYNIDLNRSWIIGDRTGDIQAGVNAGLKTVLVKTGAGGCDGKYSVEADVVCTDLMEAVERILAEV